MSALVRLAVGGAVFVLAGAAFANDLHLPSDPAPRYTPWTAGDPCASDVWCSDQALTEGFIADGEWHAERQVGFLTTGSSIVTIDALCASAVETPITGTDFPGAVTRGFAWGIGQGDAWIGSWVVSGFPPAKLYHLDSGFNVIGEWELPDSGTGLNLQFSGLAMDRARGHLWGILRNNPAGTNSRLVELDINVDPPVILQGPLDVPWPGGPSAVGSAGLDYNDQDCTILALKQDATNVGDTHLVTFQDLDPAGTASGVSLLGSCSVTNTPCTGPGQTANRPWGVALVELPTPYAVYSDLNLLADCGTIEQPADFHIIGTPAFTGTCTPQAVESRSWGYIKSVFR
jgi:hypothetical protein